jgi:hypothetical protein
MAYAMIIVGFTIMGIAVGILGVLALAVKLADRKAEPQQASVTPSAIGIDLNRNGGITVDMPLDRDTLRRVFKDLDRGIS